MKKAYYFLFYKLYKFFENSDIPMAVWLSDWKAVAIINLLECSLIFSISMYYEIFIDRYYHFLDNTFMLSLFVIIIIGSNFYIFYHNNRWKKIVNDFDKIPKFKNRLAGWGVFFFILIILAIFIYAFHLESKPDWLKPVSS